MTINTSCVNGHKLKAKESSAGKTLRCPACGADVRVPAAANESGGPALDEDPFGMNLMSLGQPAPSLAPIHKPLAQPAQPTASVQPASNKKFTIILAAAGTGTGMALGLVLLLFLWLLLPEKGQETLASSDSASVSPAASASEPATTAVKEVKDPPSQSKPDDLADVAQKLKQIALAFHNHHDSYRMFAPALVDGPTKPDTSGRTKPTRLSWRVHLLPFLDQKPLFDQFLLDEPWDSPHNKKLIEFMPECYRIQASDATTTRFQVLTGSGMLFGQEKPPQMQVANDGTSNTILVLVVGPDRSVPWTKPEDLTIDLNAPIACLGVLPNDVISCAMMDGAVYKLPKSIEPAKFLALATPAGNEIIDAATYRRRY